MKHFKFSTAVQNIKNNILLLFSAVAALCLFSSPSLTSFVIIAIVFAAVTVAAVLNVIKPPVSPMRYVKTVCIVLTALLAYKGFLSFCAAWGTFEKVATLSWLLGISLPILLRIVGVLGCVVGFYAMYITICWLVLWPAGMLLERVPVQSQDEIKENLKRNFWFPISSFSFFFLSAYQSLGSGIALLIGLIISVFLSTQISALWEQTKGSGRVLQVLSFLNAIGICLAEQALFVRTWDGSPQVLSLEAMLQTTMDLTGMIGAFGTVAAVPFVYFCVLLFWRYFGSTLRASRTFCGIHRAEWMVYGVLLFAILGYMVVSFTQSQAFYGTEFLYDIIYTSDSPSLVYGNVYLSLTHPENDLRQPLFAVFAAPFIGISYLLVRLLGASITVQAILMNSAQILMLFTANFMLAKMLRLNAVKRICFMVLSSCTYTLLLFALMMEQYIVAYFWLIFCMYQIVEKKQPDRLALWGAGGTLLIGMVLLPFMSSKSPMKDFKNWFLDMVKYALEFVALMLAFCRFDVFFTLVQKVTRLSRYTGKSVQFHDKLFQYMEFIRACFVAPDAGVNTTAENYISWQLYPATGIRLAGVLILVLVVVSAIWNRDKLSSLLAAGWVLFSAVMLLGLGWGTQENGLILYALYFGWAFLVLLFQLVEKIESKWNIPFLIPVTTMVAVLALLFSNIPAIVEMMDFAITYYPA